MLISLWFRGLLVPKTFQLFTVFWVWQGNGNSCCGRHKLYYRALDSRMRTTTSTRFDLKFFRVFSKKRHSGNLLCTFDPAEKLALSSLLKKVKPFLVPRRLSFDENVRAKEGGKEKSLAVHHQSLVSRSSLLCEKRSAWGGGWVKPSPDRKMIKLLTFDNSFAPLRHSLKLAVEWRRLSHFPAKMMLVHARAILSIEKILSSWSFSS